MSDRSNPDVRPSVEVSIDGERVARAAATRLDPKLVELGEGDGRHAFAVVVPARFRDGAEHSFAVRAPDLSYDLRTKVQTFSTPSESPLPSLRLRDAKLLVMRGVASGLHQMRQQQIDVWAQDRLLATVTPKWVAGEAGSTRFEARLPNELVQLRLEGALSLALPGMVEGGLQASAIPAAQPALKVTGHSADQLTLELQGISVDPATPLVMTTLVDGSVRSQAAVRFSAGVAIIPLQEDLDGPRSHLRLSLAGGAELAQVAVPRRLPRLTRNGGFQQWLAAGPAHWALAGDAERGFHAFSRREPQVQGLSGETVKFALNERDGEQLLLAQTLPHTVLGGDSAALTVVARSSGPANLALQLVDGSGGELCRWTVPLPGDLVWRLDTSAVTIPRDAPSIELRVLVAAGAANEVELAAVELGAPSAEGQEPPPSPQPITNASLLTWPRGVRHEGVRAREEIAEGWWCSSSAAAGVDACVLTPAAEKGPAGLLLQCRDAAGSCRLEAQLTLANALSAGGQLSVDLGTLGLASNLAVELPPFSVIDRICILRRAVTDATSGTTAAEHIEAVLARKVPLGSVSERLTFGFQWRSRAGTIEAANQEYYLAFELTAPFSLTLRDPALSFGEDQVAHEPHLQLEDRNVRLQIARLNGFEAWCSGTPVVLSSASEHGAG